MFNRRKIKNLELEIKYLNDIRKMDSNYIKYIFESVRFLSAENDALINNNKVMPDITEYIDRIIDHKSKIA